VKAEAPDYYGRTSIGPLLRLNQVSKLFFNCKYSGGKHMRIRKAFSALCSIAVALFSICFAFALPMQAEDRDHHVKVMTRNMDAGTDFNLITTATDFEQAVIDTMGEILQSRIPERAARLAAEVAETKPDIIALQEVTTWEIPFESIKLDQLDLLMKSLRKAGQHYKLAAIQELTHIEIPDTVSFTDHNVILVRSGQLNVIGSESHIYEQKMYFQLPDGTVIPFLGGWLAADVKIQDSRFKFVTTHLESAVLGVAETFDWQVNQAKELVANLNNSQFPVILTGDFNSDAEHTNNYPSDMTGSYDYIAGSGFDDAWTERNSGDPGLTWPLFGEDLMAGPAQPLERIDLIFSNGLEADSIERTGFIPDADGLYASDHAGVLAVFDLMKHYPRKNHFVAGYPSFHGPAVRLNNFRLAGYHRH
jgi:endonuclease/exonuclease/phosphatase family metal-dependent hydrolase